MWLLLQVSHVELSKDSHVLGSVFAWHVAHAKSKELSEEMQRFLDSKHEPPDDPRNSNPMLDDLLKRLDVGNLWQRGPQRLWTVWAANLSCTDRGLKDREVVYKHKRR